MNPCSFVLSAEHLYYEKKKKTISYVYIPTAYGCSGYDAFYEMAVEVSKMMTVSDTILENKVLRAIIKDFNPTEFLQMLNDYASLAEAPVIEDKAKPEMLAEPVEKIAAAVVYSSKLDVLEVNEPSVPPKEAAGGIMIDIQPETDILQGKKERESKGYRIFGQRSKKKKETDRNSNNKPLPEITLEPKQADISESTLPTMRQTGINDMAYSTQAMTSGPGLRYAGRANLPPSIHVQIAEGEIFTIGRFDSAIGEKRSSFEFEKKTKAVSRRHAVIERVTDGYRIVDLSSSAGTFVDNEKLPPNTPHRLETGCRVSFGNSGADYIWEVS